MKISKALAVAAVLFSSQFITSNPAKADHNRRNDGNRNHIVVLSYTPGDRFVYVQSVDGKATHDPLSIAPMWVRLQQLRTHRVYGPLLHSASYYAAYVLLTTTAIYFRNAELLTISSLVGVPVLLVVGARDIAKIIRGPAQPEESQ